MFTAALKLLATRIYLTVVVISVRELACHDLLPHYYPCIITGTETMMTHLSPGNLLCQDFSVFSSTIQGKYRRKGIVFVVVPPKSSTSRCTWGIKEKPQALQTPEIIGKFMFQLLYNFERIVAPFG
jgi:hypothetical protein